MYLFRLIYYSRNTVADGERSVTKEIKSILDASARNNTKLGVTGALLFNQNYFAQVLEGDREAVTETFCRIARDSRHSDIVIANASTIDERVFSEWSMVFAGRSEVADSLYRRFCIAPSFSPARMSAESLLGFIREMVQFERHVARPERSAA